MCSVLRMSLLQCLPTRRFKLKECPDAEKSYWRPYTRVDIREEDDGWTNDTDDTMSTRNYFQMVLGYGSPIQHNTNYEENLSTVTFAYSSYPHSRVGLSQRMSSLVVWTGHRCAERRDYSTTWLSLQPVQQAITSVLTLLYLHQT